MQIGFWVKLQFYVVYEFIRNLVIYFIIFWDKMVFLWILQDRAYIWRRCCVFHRVYLMYGWAVSKNTQRVRNPYTRPENFVGRARPKKPQFISGKKIVPITILLCKLAIVPYYNGWYELSKNIWPLISTNNGWYELSKKCTNAEFTHHTIL